MKNFIQNSYLNTGKVLVNPDIAWHCTGIYFSDIYPGFIFDSEIIAKANILDYIKEGYVRHWFYHSRSLQRKRNLFE